MKSFIFFLIVVGILSLLALNFHIVVTQEGTLFVKKGRMTFGDTYVNMSGWSTSEFEKHALLEEDLVASGHEDLVTSIKYPKKEVKEGSEPTPAPPPPTTEILLESGSQGSGAGQRLKDRAKEIR